MFKMYFFIIGTGELDGRKINTLFLKLPIEAKIIAEKRGC